jgi:hypothetical protein
MITFLPQNVLAPMTPAELVQLYTSAALKGSNPKRKLSSEFCHWALDFNFTMKATFREAIIEGVEAHGLTPADEALWILRWGKHDNLPHPFPDDWKDSFYARIIIPPPYDVELMC